MESEQTIVTSEHEDNRTPMRAVSLGRGLVFSIVILSLLAGAISGYFAGYLANKNIRTSGASSNGSVSLTENSAVIDVVRKASPAVVSIIISKDLSSAQSDIFSSPFFLDPFAQGQNPGTGSPNGGNSSSLQEVGAGSGFFVTSDGLIVTNKHVVSDTQAKYTVITNDGTHYSATVVSTDPVNDLALVKVSIHNAPTISFADSKDIQIGQEVVAIGNSLGQYQNTVTSGIVSGLGRSITAGGEGTSEQLDGVIQTDAAINPGNSGGPLLNSSGDAIGVNTAIDQQGQLVGFAIPSDDVQKDISSYNKSGKIIKPFLGIHYVLIDQDVQQQNNLSVSSGAWVSSNDAGTSAVVPGSAADKAGVKAGDIITAVNNNKIDQNTTLSTLIKNFNSGDQLTLQVLRNGKTLSLKCTLGQE